MIAFFSLILDIKISYYKFKIFFLLLTLLAGLMNKEILYIGFYTPNNMNKPRIANIAAIRKMDYVADALQRAGFIVHLLSPSWLTNSFSIQKSININLT